MRRLLLLGSLLLLATACGLSGGMFHELGGLPPALAYADTPDAILLQSDGTFLGPSLRVEVSGTGSGTQVRPHGFW